MNASTDNYSVLHAMYDNLLTSQYMDTDAFDAHCRSLLPPLIEHVSVNSPYYRRLLGPDGLRRLSSEIDLWPEMPVTTRETLADHYDAFLADDYPDNHGRARMVWTRNGTERRLRIPRTVMADTADHAALLRHWHDHRFDCTRPLARLVGPDDGIRRNFHGQIDPNTWGRPWDPDRRKGPVTSHSHMDTLENQLDWLLSLDAPVHLEAPVAAVRRLLDGDGAGSRLEDRIAAVHVRGEPVTQEFRRACRRKLGCRVIATGESAECGLYAAQCTDCDAYHAQSEICLVEILQDDGAPCGIGEEGWLTITPFYNYALPLLRYRTGERATFLNLCLCGRSTACFAPTT